MLTMKLFIKSKLLFSTFICYLLIFKFSLEKKDEETVSIKEDYEGNLDDSVKTSPIVLPQSQTSIYSISSNVTCLNKPIEFHQVKSLIFDTFFPNKWLSKRYFSRPIGHEGATSCMYVCLSLTLIKSLD